MVPSSRVREASHAGSWYTSNASQLSKQLDQWLDAVDKNAISEGTLPLPGARAVISPHAGYSYSGPAAAWAYKSLDLTKAKRIFLLHPSHHVHLRTAALPECRGYETPLSDDPLPLDHEVLEKLSGTPIASKARQNDKFGTMSQNTDENEHSGEMQLPYIHRLLQKLYPDRKTKDYPPLVPMMIGSTNPDTERTLGRILAPYINDEENAFVISSDFCHWGSRFSYTYYMPDAPSPSIPATSLPNGVGGDSALDIHKQHDWHDGIMIRGSQAPKSPKIFESIAQVDRACMCAIASGSHDEFMDIIEATGNTVCGRHPIGVFLAGVEEAKKLKEPSSGLDHDLSGKFRFMRYERSSDVIDGKASSVSYVSAFAVL